MKKVPDKLLYLLLLFLPLYEKIRKVKDVKSTVFYGCPLTVLLQYWYPEASYLICLHFPPLVFHPNLKQISIILVPIVLPNDTKVLSLFFTEYDLNFLTLLYEEM